MYVCLATSVYGWFLLSYSVCAYRISFPDFVNFDNEMLSGDRLVLNGQAN